MSASSFHLPLLCNGLADAPASLLLAHGAGAPMDSPFMETMATGLADRGWRVLRFEFPYMARSRQSGRRHGPDRQPVLLDAWRSVVAAHAADGPLLIGGKSMGGRMASMVLDELAAEHGLLGCLCLGYPFHPPGKPEALRLDHLRLLRNRCLIVQGERDSFGRRAEVESYGLQAPVQLAWLADGDHSFKPSKRSGFTEQSHIAAAVQHSDRFMRQCLAEGPMPG
jgi:predicted alpha/beta-hydrolase family hydrolase